MAGGGSGEQRRRGRGSVPAAALVLARLREMQGNELRWKLEWGLGKSSETLAGGGSERRGVLACGGGKGELTRRSCDGGLFIARLVQRWPCFVAKHLGA
jgi:hypothetical protein